MTLRAFLAAACVALVVTGAASGAQTTVQPASGKAGTRVAVRGSGFAGARAGWIRLGASRKAVRTNGAGAFSTWLVVPRLSVGQKRLVARIGSATVVNLFAVTRTTPGRLSSRAATSTGRRVLLSPSAGRAGTRVSVAVAGFPPGAAVQVSFAGSLQASGTASSRGTFSASFAVPDLADGARTVTVASGGSSVRLGFRVLRPPASAACRQPAGSGSWSSAPAPMPRALLDAGGAVVGGKLYAVGGKTTGDVHERTLYVYDPARDRWTQGPPLPAAYPAVENAAVVGYNGKLYVFGGAQRAFGAAVARAAVFDPRTSGWKLLASMSVARGGATAQPLGGKIYVAGGMDTSGSSLASVEVYDPARNTWSSARSMETRRDNPGSAVLRDATGTLKLYVFGGRTRNADGTADDETLATVEAYDPASERWTARAPMPTGRRVIAVGALNGCAQVLGGERTASGGSFAANEEYNPLTNEWRTLAPMRTPRHGAAAGTIGGVVYVAGGGPRGGSSWTAVNEAFRR